MQQGGDRLHDGGACGSDRPAAPGERAEPDAPPPEPEDRGSDELRYRHDHLDAVVEQRVADFGARAVDREADGDDDRPPYQRHDDLQQEIQGEHADHGESPLDEMKRTGGARRGGRPRRWRRRSHAHVTLVSRGRRRASETPALNRTVARRQAALGRVNATLGVRTALGRIHEALLTRALKFPMTVPQGDSEACDRSPLAR